MENLAKQRLIAIFFLLVSISFYPQSKTILDAFNTASKWKIITSDLVTVSTSTTAGVNGSCLQLDYHFVGGSGYGGIQGQFPLILPQNYEFSFYLKANSPNNNLEFKLLDSTGTSVWWDIIRDYSFPKGWTKIRIKHRHITKAWGPSPETKPSKIYKIEFMISSVNGGKGRIYLDDFTFTPLEVENSSPITPVLIEPTAVKNNQVLFDKNPRTKLILKKSDDYSLIVDLQKSHEFGGLKLVWGNKNHASRFTVFLSEDQQNWENVYNSNGVNNEKNFVPLPEVQARYIKVKCEPTTNNNEIALGELEILGLDFSSSMNNVYRTIARENPRGYFPKYFNDEASFFTVLGVNGDRHEALINEEGQVEVNKSSFSLEPFLFTNGSLVTWNNSKNEQTLEEGYLPIPSVTRKTDHLSLTIKAFADGNAGHSFLNVCYSLRNTSTQKQEGKIYFAVRPFQVNPLYQFLNTQGGASKVSSISLEYGKVKVNDKVIYPLELPAGFGATTFDGGDIISYISKNKLPGYTSVVDEREEASAAFSYSYSLKPNEEKKYYFIVPFHGDEEAIPTLTSQMERDKFVDSKLRQVKYLWKEKLTAIDIQLPPKYQKWVNTLRSTLAYILINRDSVGIQPGSRSYERSWIRDGALTSSALLKFGVRDEVKEFINWYTSFQYANGKVPCVVDKRGADPVPENDSHGELIFLINQYFLFTKDTAFLKSKFENVVKAVDYIDLLSNQRKTDEYKNIDSLKPFYGLLPESISHEGYSEKPMHSYWDDFFAIKGLKDAVDIASVLGEKEYVKKFTALRNEFSKNLENSLRLAIERKKINYLPGCTELGDFDATSTAISLYPCNEKKNLPEPYLMNTFNKYFEFFERRRDDTSYQWINYTPYEVRISGAFIYLNEPERAHALLNFFFKDQHPQGWNHWAEVVWKDPKTPKFIGDMPHTWVGSDFISSLRSFFVYEDELNNSLVLGEGIIPDWINSKEGMSCKNLQTYYGSLSFSVKKIQAQKYDFEISGKTQIPLHGIQIRKLPLAKPLKRLFLNNEEIKIPEGEFVVIKKLPAVLRFEE